MARNPEIPEVIDLAVTPPPAAWGVLVDDEALARLAADWSATPFELPVFNYPGTPANRQESWWFDYVTMAVSVLACLWAPEGHDIWHVEHDGEWLDDAPGIFAAFTHQLSPTGLDLDRFATMTDADAHDLFAGRGTLLQIPERGEALRQAAQALKEHWHGSAANLVTAADRNGAEIVRLLIETVPAYYDRPRTTAGIAHFDKLAHLAAAIMAAGVGWDAAGFKGYENFPVYPDYMLPRVFRHHGAMIYSDELARTIDTRQLVAQNSDEEHAIRWASVYCGARLQQHLASHGVEVTGPALDYRLWSVAVLGPDAAQFGEHHRTVTMRY